jgi:hypothetical protein
MFGEADALLLRFNDAGVGGEVAGIELNLYLVIGFAHLDPAANPGDRDRVAIGVQGDVAFDIDGALMEPVDFGNPDWQRLQPRLLDGEQVARRRVQVFLMASVDPVAPLARLLVEILPRREPSSSKEVGLDEPEWPFDASGTVRIAAFVSGKIEAETFGESRHLGHRNHLGPRAAQDYDVSVVDHHSFCETAEVASGVGQKDLAIEPLERRVALKEDHARVTQHGGCGLDLAFLAADFDLMRRGVVLQFLARFKVVAAGRHDGRLPDSVPAAKPGERLIRQGRSASLQFFMDPDQIPFALL